MSETIKHWSKTVNKLVNNINVNNNQIVNITTGVDTVGNARNADEATRAKGDPENSTIKDTYSPKSYVDSSFVKVSGEQTIAGVKTFSDNPVVATGNNASITLKSTDRAITSNLNVEEVCGINIEDKDGTPIGQFAVHIPGSKKNIISAQMFASNGDDSGALTVDVKSGLVYATAPSTPAGSSDNEIVTADYLINANVGSANTATKLKNPIEFSLEGDATGTVSFDGSGTLNTNGKIPVALSVTVDGTKHSHTISNVEGLESALVGKASINSPSLLGEPTAPTAAAGTNTTQVATTAFVTTAVKNQATIDASTYATKTDVKNQATTDASTYATKTELSAKAPSASPALTGTPTAPTAAAGTNNTQIATTAFVTTAVKNQATTDASTYATKEELSNIGDSLATVATTGSYNDLSDKPTSLKNPTSLTIQNSAGTSIGSYDGSTAKTVKLDASTVGLGNVTNESKATMFTSPSFTGTPTAPTATAGTNTTQVATTAFVTTAVNNQATTDASTYATKTELSNIGDSLATVATTGSYNDLSDKPTSLKNPTSLTLQNSAGTSIGSYDGSTAKTIKLTSSTVGLGNVTNESKSTMFTSPALTGTPTAPTATAGTNTTQVATTAFVTTAVNNKVSGPSEAVSGQIAVFDGTTGKVIKDSGFTIATSVPSNAKFTDTNTKVTQTITTTNAEYALLAMADAAATATKTNGARFASAVTLNPSSGTITATTFKGALSGNASTATTATTASSCSGNAGTATTLATARTIDGVSFNGSANILHYGTCSTAAGTAAKTVALTGFKLDTGSRVMVKFTVTNTAANPTLNVNSTGAKSIMYRGSAITADYLAANRVYEFVYDGTNYELVGDINTDTNTKLYQQITTTNAEYALLAMSTASATATKTEGGRFASGVTLNPATKTITATTFKGALDGNAATATTASSCSGNAATATTASSCSGNAATATKLANARNIALTGDVTGSASFNGTAAASIAATLATSGVTAGSYGPSANATPAFGGTFSVPYITVDAKGRATAASTKTITIPALNVSNATAGTLAIARGGTGSSTKNFVDLSENQTIGGEKTYTGNVTLKNSNVTVGTNPSSTSYKEIFFVDSTGSTASEHRLANIYSSINTDGVSQFCLEAYKYDASNTNYTKGNLYINITKAGVVTAGTNGTFTATAVYNAVWNDYAEFFPRGEETEAGDFVALSLDSDNEVYVKASKETSKSVGIHSDSFGHLIGGENAPEGQDFVEYNLPKYIPVGLVGRVRANIVGEVKKGDFIVISDIPGVGRAFNKETDSYVDIIGMACESSSEKDIKRIKVKLGN